MNFLRRQNMTAFFLDCQKTFDNLCDISSACDSISAMWRQQAAFCIIRRENKTKKTKNRLAKSDMNFAAYVI